MNTFLNITSEECQRVYPVITANAKNHFVTAVVLADAQQYAGGITHLILGTEEYMKAFIIFLESYEFGVRNIKGIKALFSNHVARHTIISHMFPVYGLISDIFIRRMPSKIPRLAKLTLVAVDTYTAAISYRWWLQADTLKQQTLYVDYVDKLTTPKSFTKEDYRKTLKETNKIRKQILSFIRQIKQLSANEVIELKKLLGLAGLPELIKEVVKKEKTN